MENKIPDGWCFVKLEEVAEQSEYPIGDGDHGQIKPSMYRDNGIPYIRVSDMRWGTLNLKEVVYISKEVHRSNLKSFLKPGDVLIAKTGATIGKCGILPETIEEANTTSSVGKISLDRNLMLPKWLLYYFLTREFKEFIWSISERTAQPGFNNRDIKLFNIPLPPIAEQYRIVAKLDELMEKIDRTRGRLERIPRILKRFRQSVLAAAVSGNLTEGWRERSKISHEWVETTLGKTLMSLDQGWSPKCENFPSQSEDKWGVIKTTAVQHMYFLEQENKQLPSQLKPEKKFELKVNDVLITRAGPRIRVGVCCHVTSVRARLMICDKVYRLRVNEEILLPGFVEILLNTYERLEELEGMKTGISDSGVNLTQHKIKEMLFQLPSVVEQLEIVRRVKQLFEVADKIESRYRKAKEQIDKLPQSLLVKAFRGEVAPQDPNDEPASMLLDRIRSERESRASKKAKTSRVKKGRSQPAEA
jgi:type I restriction enzyme S subunit